MCKVFISKTEYKDLTLIEKDQIKYTYSSDSKNIVIKVINKLHNFIPLQDFINISKNKIIGIEKIIDFDINSEPIKIVFESYNPIKNPKTYNELINLGLEIINILSNLYKLNIKNFELSTEKLCENNLGFIIIKDIYIILDKQNHIYQLCKILEVFSKNIVSNNEDRNIVQDIICKCLDNKITDINALRESFIGFLNKVPIPNSVKNTNSYTKIDLEIFNEKIKYNNIISQIKSDKIVNFNVCNSNNIINKFKDFKWLEKIESQISSIESTTVSFRDYLKIERKFTGIIIINNEIRIFLFNGYLIGAFNILNKNRDDFAISNINIINSVEIKELNNNLSIILNNLLSSGIILCKESNYFSEDVLETLNKISTTNFNGYLTININGYKFFITYNNGIEQFILSENEHNTNIIDKNSLMNIILSYDKEIKLEVYILKFGILRYSFNQILDKTIIKINYFNENEGTLSNILRLGNEYIPNKIKESTIKNLIFNKILPIGEKLEILNGELSLSQLIDSSITYKFVKWVITDLFFEINKNDFRNIINNIPDVNNISFLADNNTLNSYMKKDDKILFTSRKGDGSLNDFTNFVSLLKDLKNNQDSFISGFYISQEDFSSEVLIKYKELTKVYSLSIMKFKNNNKSYIKLSNKTGFNLFLVTYKFNIFEIINY
ncbi:MAG: hypothetical protein U0354_18880 [Candidatus Sericytochromatia bacterium]